MPPVSDVAFRQQGGCMRHAEKRPGDLARAVTGGHGTRPRVNLVDVGALAHCLHMDSNVTFMWL